LQDQILRVQNHIQEKDRKNKHTKDRIEQHQNAVAKYQRLLQEEQDRLAKHQALKESSAHILTGLTVRLVASR
jgi:peptidoglycan hydrolase CwlO-like protein